MEDVIQTYAYIAWEEYYNIRAEECRGARRDGNGPWNTKKNGFAYTKIARFCHEHNMDVREFVRAAYKLVQMRGVTVKAADLSRPEVMEQCLVESGEHGQSPAELWLYQVVALTQVRIIDPTYTSDAEVLNMASLSFTPWFRVLYIQPFHEGLFADYGTYAWDALRHNRLLREFLRQKTPVTMREFERRTARFGDAV